MLDLLHKGILYLTPQAGPLAQEKPGWGSYPLEEFAGTPPGETQGKGEKDRGLKAAGIRELESQTTPTCLSSYIRRW